MAWPLANNQVAWTCRADLASRAARNRPARSSRLRCAATCTMLVSHEPRRVNLQAASPPATPAERSIRKPYETNFGLTPKKYQSGETDVIPNPVDACGEWRDGVGCSDASPSIGCSPEHGGPGPALSSGPATP